MLSKEYYGYKIHTSLTKTIVYPLLLITPSIWNNPPAFLQENLDLPSIKSQPPPPINKGGGGGSHYALFRLFC